MAIYVDDGLVAENDEQKIKAFLKALEEEFKITTNTLR